MTPTLRRLQEGERWLWWTWRGWAAALVGGGILYGAVRLSPLGLRPTVTITLLILAAVGMGLYALSGQALGPERYLLVVIRYRRSPKQFACPEQADNKGLMLDAIPNTNSGVDTREPITERAQA